jgi:hypothetical protein
VTADYLEDSIPWHQSLPVLQSIRQNATQLERIGRAACISRYAGKVAGLASVLVVSSNITMSQRLSDDRVHPGSSLLSNFTTIEGPGTDWGLNSDWMCSAWAVWGHRSSMAYTEQFLMNYNETWTLAQLQIREHWIEVDYCLPMAQNRPMDAACALRLSPAILYIVMD